MTSAEKPSLYERLGGVYSIATVVDDFINRIMVDARLNANPLVDEAHHRVPPSAIDLPVYLCGPPVAQQTISVTRYLKPRSARNGRHS